MYLFYCIFPITLGRIPFETDIDFCLYTSVDSSCSRKGRDEDKTAGERSLILAKGPFEEVI